jgi:hypothetical protein
MPIINLTAADRAKNKTIESKWYPALVKNISDLKASAKGDSMNVVVTFLIDTPEVDGKEIERAFNSKAMGMIDPFLTACNDGKEVDLGQVDLSKFEGKKIDVKVDIETYEGRLKNAVNGWLPLGKGTAGPSF